MTFKGRIYKIVSHWTGRVNLHKGKSTDELLITESVRLLEPEYKKRCFCLILDGPDSVWSWVIAFINFFINFVVNGLGRMSGILYVEFMIYFGISRKTASLPFSVQRAGRNLFGPLTGICGQKYGIRFVTILGGLVGSLSAAAIYFKLDITTVTAAWGLLFGLSIALTTTLNQISIDQYFERNRTTAGGFAVAGGSVGALVFPVVLETLLHVYGIRGTFLILAGVILLVVPASVMLVEPPWIEREESPRSHAHYGSTDDDDSTWSVEFIKEVVTEVERSNGGIAKPRQQQHFVDFRLLRENSDLVFKFLTMDLRDEKAGRSNGVQKHDRSRLMSEVEAIYASVSGEVPHPAGPRCPDTSGVSDTRSNGLAAQEEVQASDLLNIIDNLPRKVYIRNRLRELSQAPGTNLIASFAYWEQSTAWSVLVELRRLHEAVSDQAFVQRPRSTTDFRMPKPKPSANDSPRSSKGRSNTCCSHLKTALRLHTNPIFLLICLCRVVYNITFNPVVMIIVDFAMDLGLPRSDGKYVISVLSVGDLVGRLGMGWITDCGCLSLPMFMFLGLLALGMNSAALPMLDSRAALLAGVFVYGALQGSLYTRHPILVSKYLEHHEQAIGMGFINFLSGPLSLAVPAYIGFFRDGLGSYNKMYYANGLMCGAVGLIWLLEPLFLLVCSANHNEKKKLQTS